MSKDVCKSKISELTGKKNVFLTARCSSAIQDALKYAHSQGRTTALLQDAGGWMNYPKDCKVAQVGIKYVPTNNGLLSADTILEHGDKNCVLLLTSSAGYHALQNMDAIMHACRQKDVLVINDVSGSIGEKEATSGDIIVCSFGKWKPLDVGKGGFCATNLEIDCEEVEIDTDVLLEKITHLPHRMQCLYKDCTQIKNDLVNHTILNKENKGSVVIVAYHGEEELDQIMEYCNTNELEYTLCPREIRVLISAISIEVKRKQYK